MFQEAYAVESAGIAAAVRRGRAPLAALDRWRVGRGQTVEVGSTAREPLVVAVTDLAGAPSAGETVAFARVAGGGEPLSHSAPAAGGAHVGVSDERGQVLLDLQLPSQPDATIVVASALPDQVTAFRVVAHAPNEEIAARIAAV
jgi:hypothetical protein